MASFLSTLPARGATLTHTQLSLESIFLSTLPARGATTCRAYHLNPFTISIHAPREGSDRRGQAEGDRPKVISIHAPREGSDLELLIPFDRVLEFLSTLPARGATGGVLKRHRKEAQFLSTLPARGATRTPNKAQEDNTIFLSTLPARGATSQGVKEPAELEISIHAPREGSDAISFPVPLPGTDFYPRSPRGERRRGTGQPGCRRRYFYPRSPRGERPGRWIRQGHGWRLFLSTLPARGATEQST